jgi:Pyruvate/2-oxoacid:ferredoxin oxidoreductase gamma subunit
LFYKKNTLSRILKGKIPEKNRRTRSVGRNSKNKTRGDLRKRGGAAAVNSAAKAVFLAMTPEQQLAHLEAEIDRKSRLPPAFREQQKKVIRATYKMANPSMGATGPPWIFFLTNGASRALADYYLDSEASLAGTYKRDLLILE